VPASSGNPHPRLAAEMLRHRRCSGLYATLFHRFTCAAQYAVMAMPVAQIQPHYLRRLALRYWSTLLRLLLFFNGWSPFCNPRVRIESLAFDEASRLIPSKAAY